MGWRGRRRRGAALAVAALCLGVAAGQPHAVGGERLWAQAEPAPPTATAPPTAPEDAPNGGGARADAAAPSATPGSAGTPPASGPLGAATAGPGPTAPPRASAPTAVSEPPPAGAPDAAAAPPTAPASVGTDAAVAAPAEPPAAAGVPPAPPPDALALPPGESSAGPGRILYADNFSDPASGWPVQSSDAATRRVGYADGEYYVARLPGSGGSPYVMREEPFGDFLLEVDARLLEPTADAYVFVDFRRQPGGEHYSFVVAPDEGAFIVRRNTDRTGVTVLDWTRAAAIQPGPATNRLGVRARGDELTLLVNGEAVGQARAEDTRAGGFGFGVGSLNDGAAEARFRNLVITSLE